MAKTLRLQIVTPQGTVYSEDVELVGLQTLDGQIAILPNHIRLMTQMLPGEMIVRRDGHDEFLAVGEGLVDVTSNSVDIATDMAIAAEKIDEAKVEGRRKRVKAGFRGR